MNGIHDVGGMHGFGAVHPEKDEPVFHEPWEGRVYGMRARFGALFPPPYPGVSRGYIESIPPATYLDMSYYERFLDALVRRAIDEGVITVEELEARIRLLGDQPTATVPARSDPVAVADTLKALKTQSHPAKSGRPPRFKEGDAVQAVNVNRSGHNRLPRYIRGHRGTIARVNGLHPIEDEKVYAEDPAPQTIYTVGFAGSEVWGPECEPNLRIYMELWEDYLQPA